LAPRIPIIAIVGRPNVGKSTLFNRVLGEHRAIVEDVPGVTRDRNYALVERFDVPFLLVDTGGIDPDTGDEISERVLEQTLVAAEEADIILALFDGAQGCQENDREVVRILRKYDKPVYYVVNKCDGDEQALRTADFYQLGIETLYDCSALHGRRVQLLFEMVLKSLPNFQALYDSARAREEREQEAETHAGLIADEELSKEEIVDPEGDFELDEDFEEKTPNFAPVYLPEEALEGLTPEQYEKEYRLLKIEDSEARELPSEEENLWEEDPQAFENDVAKPIDLPIIRVALVGRPNVGKSTLINTLTGEQRAITSPVAGTTRDALDLKIRREGQDFVFIDTAGLRKQARISEAIEKFSAMRSLSAMAASDVAVVVLDGTMDPGEQDAKIVGLAHEQGIGLVIAVNKWDLVEKNHRSVHSYTEKVREAFKFAPYAPIVFISALSGRRCPWIIETVRDVAYERAKRVPTSHLNQILKRALKRFSPPPYRGRDIKLFYGVQVDVSPPRFALFFNFPKALHFSFLRFLKNALRKEYGFVGTDIKLLAKKK